jgi:hypothetical protein
MTMMPIKSVIDSFFSQQNHWQIRLTREWKTLVGDLHIRMRLEKIQQHTVVVGVYDFHWMQELYLLAPMLLRTINKGLGGAYVQQLRFTLAKPEGGKMLRSGRHQQMHLNDIQVQHAKKPLREQHRAALERISDAQLREYLYAYFQRCE